MRLAPGTRLCLVLLLVLSMAGCQADPPEWQYFDTERHPAGAIPANVGFYTGAYVIAPSILLLFALLIPFTGEARGMRAPRWDGIENFSRGIGLGTGLILGAPFHLVALPFGTGGKYATASRYDEPEHEETPVHDPAPDYDDTPPKVPRDYPWPPKPPA